MTRATALCLWRRNFYRKRSLNTLVVIIGLCMLVKLHTFSHYVQQETVDKTLPMTSIVHQSNYDNGSHVIEDSFRSAYFDDRPIGIGEVFRIFGLESVNPEGDLYCNTRTLNWGSNSECSHNLTRVKRVPLGNEVHKMKAYMYLCPSTHSHGDITVTLARKPSCENITTLAVRVTDGYSRTLDNVTSGFAVCLSGALGRAGASFQMQDLIEFVEMSRILGANKIFLYSNQTSFIEELRYYSSKIELLKNTLQIIPWSILAGDSLGNADRILIMNDCLYRNLFKVKYIVFQTLQDMLVPSKLWSWWDLISSLRLLHNSSLVGAYVFSAVSYYDETATNTSMYRLETTDGNAKAYKLPKIVSHRVREKSQSPTLIDSGLIVEAKKIASIEPSSVPVMLPGFLYFPVPMEYGHLHRFLSRGRKLLKHLVVDSSTDRYVRPLLRSMHQNFYRRMG